MGGQTDGQMGGQTDRNTPVRYTTDLLFGHNASNVLVWKKGEQLQVLLHISISYIYEILKAQSAKASNDIPSAC